MKLKQTSVFDIDTLKANVIGIAANLGRHDSGIHQHQKAQLLYAPRGCITITLNNIQCVLPPTKAIWIPAETTHCAKVHNMVAFRSIYFDVKTYPQLPKTVKVFGVNSLLQALIERMAFWESTMEPKSQQALVTLFMEELLTAPDEPLQLTLPTDPRLTQWLLQLRSRKIQPEPLNRMASTISASEKTISRIFTKQTGMPYQAWRQQWRLHSAIEELAEGMTVSHVASSQGFSSDSAFISFFKQQLGSTPGQFIKFDYPQHCKPECD